MQRRSGERVTTKGITSRGAMSNDPHFDELMARLEVGDEPAAVEVCDRFVHLLLTLARQHLDGATLRKLDPEDVVQSAYKSFFVKFREGHYQLTNWDSLWGLLLRITLRKCRRKMEYFRAEKRDVRRERPVDPLEDSSVQEPNAAARDPTPFEAAVLAETVEDVMRGLNQAGRQIVCLSLQGHSVVQISEQSGRTERTVERVLARLRERLERMPEEDAES